jgi:transaldolase
VASFFVSRIDEIVDPLLEKVIIKGGKEAALAKKLHGQVAISSAKMAYKIYKEMFGSDRFMKLTAKGALIQRPLWASTSAKNADCCDMKYVEALIGPETVNTVPMETLVAYRDHGVPKARLEQDLNTARTVLQRLPDLGISIDMVTQQLEDEGVENFIQPFDKLIDVLAQRSPRQTSTAS